MSFSYALVLSLLLLAPGFSAWAGLRLGEQQDFVSQAPERPGSTFSLLVIVVGALAGHMAMAMALAVQESWCLATGRCLTIKFDPNIYRAVLGADKARISGISPDRLSAWAILYWLTSLLLPAVATGATAWRMSRWQTIWLMRERSRLGWLQTWMEEARSAKRVVLAYAVTTMAHEGAYVAYEGLLVNIALDDNGAIAKLVLRDCDRFLVKITEDGVRRVDAPTSIGLIQLEARNCLNIALELFGDPSAMS